MLRRTFFRAINESEPRESKRWQPSEVLKSVNHEFFLAASASLDHQGATAGVHHHGHVDETQSTTSSTGPSVCNDQ